MNYPILKAAIDARLLNTHPSGNVVSKSNGVHTGGNMQLLFGNAIMKGKAS
jgi:hypothetical protein